MAIDLLTAIIYGRSYGLIDKGDEEYHRTLKLTESNWKTYYWCAMLPPLGKIIKLVKMAVVASGVMMSGGRPPIPILGVRQHIMYAGSHHTETKAVDGQANSGRAEKGPER